MTSKPSLLGKNPKMDITAASPTPNAIPNPTQKEKTARNLDHGRKPKAMKLPQPKTSSNQPQLTTNQTHIGVQTLKRTQTRSCCQRFNTPATKRTLGEPVPGANWDWSSSGDTGDDAFFLRSEMQRALQSAPLSSSRSSSSFWHNESRQC